MEFLEDEKGDWAGISGFNFHFMTVTGAEKSTSIYNNKRNQAVISIQLAMTDSDGKPLNEDNSPTIDVVKKSLQLCNYYNFQQVMGSYPAPGSGSSTQGWYQSFSSLGFHFKDVSIRDDSGDNFIRDGMAYITIYACCDDKASFESLSLGFISTIPGKMESQSKIYINASGFKDTFSINISSKQSLEYDIDSLSIKAQRVVHNNEGRDGDIALGSYDVGGCYRQFDYTIGFSPATQSRYSTRLYKALVDGRTPYPPNTPELGEGADYAFGNRGLGAYGMKGYFWPVNVYNSEVDNEPLSVETAFFMDTPVTGSIKTNILYKDDQLYLTLLCYGGGDINYQFTRTPFLVTFYDQYGNQGQFLIDPDKLPEGYNPDQFTNSNFTLLSVPTANLLTGQTGETTNYFSLVCVHASGAYSFLYGNPTYAIQDMSVPSETSCYLNPFTDESGLVKFRFSEGVSGANGQMLRYMIIDDKAPFNDGSGNFYDVSPKEPLALSATGWVSDYDYNDGLPVPSCPLSKKPDQGNSELLWVVYPAWDNEMSVVFYNEKNSTSFCNYLPFAGGYSGFSLSNVIPSINNSTSSLFYHLKEERPPS